MTAGCCALLGKGKITSWAVVAPIMLIPALVVSIWLSKLINVPYAALAGSLLVGQAIAGAVGAVLVRALRNIWREN